MGSNIYSSLFSKSLISWVCIILMQYTKLIYYYLELIFLISLFNFKLSQLEFAVLIAVYLYEKNENTAYDRYVSALLDIDFMRCCGVDKLLQMTFYQ